MKARLIQPSTHSSKTTRLAKAAMKRNNKVIQLTKILVPTDFSKESKKAIGYAQAFARQFGAAITLLHVVEVENCPTDFGYGPVMIQVSSKEKLKKAKLKLDGLGRQLISKELLDKTLAVSGVAYVEIIEAAQALEIDLIILGTHGDDREEQTPMGSTAERVVRHAHCPVFVVRSKEHEFVL